MSGQLRGPEDLEQAFYRAYGVAMANWANLEYELGNTFIAMTKMPEPLGRSVFFSARSFLGRAEMMEACIPYARVLPVARTFLVDAVKLARSWQSARNKLAHDMHSLQFAGPEGGFHYAITKVGGGSIGQVEIEAACENFYTLSTIVMHSRGRQKLVREPELCAEALALLSTDALVDEGARLRAAPLLARIQACDD